MKRTNDAGDGVKKMLNHEEEIHFLPPFLFFIKFDTSNQPPPYKKVEQSGFRTIYPAFTSHNYVLYLKPQTGKL